MPDNDGSPFPPAFAPTSVDDEAPAAAGLVTRRAVTAAGLAGVTLLAACQTLPIPRGLNPVKRPGATPTASVTSTSLPTVTVPPTVTTTVPTTTTTSAPTTTTTATTTTATTATTTTATTATTTTSTTAPPPPTQLPLADLLARRATFGPTRVLMNTINTMGVAAWLDQQLAANLPDPAGDAITAAWPDLNRPYADLIAAKFEAYRLPRQIQARAVARAAWSSRQLLEVMAQFWGNHLNVGLYGDDVQVLPRPNYDTAVIRAHALGKFADMLVASARHPSMMIYLNLAFSNKGNPNENYAREILELHTVGVDGGYTETDVKELAKLLTGWRVQTDRNGGTPYFEPNSHFVGPVTVMGRAFPNPTANGEPVLAEVANYLARRPETARYLAFKLARHFVADEPPAALVDRLAQVYLASDTAIAPVLRALFLSAEFGASSGAKLRRPFERFVATLRLVAPQPPANIAQGASQLLDRLPAQQPLEWPTPDGYPDTAASWLSAGTALDLFNTGAEFLFGQPAAGGVLGVRQLLVANPTTFVAVASAAAQIVLLREPTPVETKAVVDLLAASPFTQPLAAKSDAQRRSAELAAALLLASPAHLTR